MATEGLLLPGTERITSSSTRVDPMTVRRDGERIPNPSPLHLVMHKPAGRVCSRSLAEGPNVFEVLPRSYISRSPTLHTVCGDSCWVFARPRCAIPPVHAFAFPRCAAHPTGRSVGWTA